MIAALVFLFLFMAVCAFLMMFLLNFFIPALKTERDGALPFERGRADDLFALPGADGEGEPAGAEDDRRGWDFPFWASLRKILRM